MSDAILEHYSIPTSDGTVLDGYVRRPPGDEKQPLVLVITPYYGGGDPDFAGNALGDPSGSFATHLMPYGYAVGFVSVGGTGNSGGCFHNGGEIERKQLYDAVEYLASQPWSNGAVASIGVSYDGTTANELFVDPPPSLKAVVPMEAISDYYRYTFNIGGVARADNTFFTEYYYPIVGLSPAGLEGGVGPSDPTGWVQELSGEPCPEQLQIQQDGITTEISADKNAYWQERDAIALVMNSLDKPRPAMFLVQGLQDANVDPQMTDGWLEAAAATGVPLHVWFGQWVHEYPESSTCQELAPCRGDFFELALLAWFDQFLKGKDTGILDAPAIQVQADDGKWRHENVWPPVAETLSLYPQADGKLGVAAGSGTAAYVDASPNHYSEGNTGTVVPFPVSVPGSSVEFVSEPLAADLRLSGLPRMLTLATADNVRASIIATLMERKPDGTQRYLNFGAINLNHAVSLEQGDTDITGKPLSAAFNFYPQDNVVSAGSQLVLHLGGDIETERTTSGGSSNFLNYGMNVLPFGIGANVELDLSQTRLDLPVNQGNRLEPLSWLE